MVPSLNGGCCGLVLDKGPSIHYLCILVGPCGAAVIEMLQLHCMECMHCLPAVEFSIPNELYQVVCNEEPDSWLLSLHRLHVSADKQCN